MESHFDEGVRIYSSLSGLGSARWLPVAKEGEPEQNIQVKQPVLHKLREGKATCMAPNEVVDSRSRCRWSRETGRATSDDERGGSRGGGGCGCHVVALFGQSLAVVDGYPRRWLFYGRAGARRARVRVTLVIVGLDDELIFLVLLDGCIDNLWLSGSNLWKLRLRGLRELRGLLLCLLLFGGLLEELLTTFLALDETEISNRFRIRQPMSYFGGCR